MYKHYENNTRTLTLMLTDTNIHYTHKLSEDKCSIYVFMQILKKKKKNKRNETK